MKFFMSIIHWLAGSKFFGTWNMELGIWNMELGTWNMDVGWLLEHVNWNLDFDFEL